MKNITKDRLFTAWAYCDEYDKSTEFMLEYMQDFANVDLDCVLDFLQKTSDKTRDEWYKNNPDWYKKYE